MTSRISILISYDLNSFNLKCQNKNLIKYGENFHSCNVTRVSRLSSRVRPSLNSGWSSRTSSSSVLSSLCRTDRSRSLSPTTSSSTRKGSTSCAWCSRLWINSTMTSFAPSARVSNFSSDLRSLVRNRELPCGVRQPRLRTTLLHILPKHETL